MRTLVNRVCDEVLDKGLLEPYESFDPSYANYRLKEISRGGIKMKSTDGNLAPTITTATSNFGFAIPKLNVVGSMEGGKWDNIHESCRRVYDVDGLSPTINTQGGGNQEVKIVVDSVYTETEKALFTEDGNIKRYLNSDVVDKFEDGQMATTTFPNGYDHGPRTHNESISLNTIDRPSVKHNLRIRKLTPRECWRLMGFSRRNEDGSWSDDAFDAASKINSNAQLYKQAGNSIVVDCLESILTNLFLEQDHNEYKEISLF